MKILIPTLLSAADTTPEKWYFCLFKMNDSKNWSSYIFNSSFACCTWRKFKKCPLFAGNESHSKVPPNSNGRAMHMGFLSKIHVSIVEDDFEILGRIFFLELKSTHHLLHSLFRNFHSGLGMCFYKFQTLLWNLSRHTQEIISLDQTTDLGRAHSCLVSFPGTLNVRNSSWTPAT